MNDDILPTFGLWPSPITPKSLAQSLRLGDLAWDTDGETLVWLEGRGDRNVLVCTRLDGDAPRDLTDELSVRARVGYGGGDFCVGLGQVFFISNGRIYAQALSSGKARAITPAFGQAASPVLARHGRWLLYVYSAEGRDGIAAIDAKGELWPRKVTEGHDFYMQPRISPDSRMAAWISWDHPQMPWDGSILCISEIEENLGLPIFKNERRVIGGTKTAVFQPEFSPDGRFLAFLCDDGGWHNLYLYDLGTGVLRKLSDEYSAQLGVPAWGQGQRTFGFSADSRAIYCVRNERGFSSLVSYEVSSGKQTVVSGLQGYAEFQQPAINPIRPQISVVVSAGRQAPRLIVKSLDNGLSAVIKRTQTESVSVDLLAVPIPVSWQSNSELIHGLLYLPNGFAGGSGAPTIIRAHGGPTGQFHAEYNPSTQFFVTRGYVVLEVNYRGSTGYGRGYMEALRGNWGVFDVEDVVSGAKYLAREGYTDSTKTVIMGGSAGGYTVLQALVTHPGFFKAGICLYGVSNLFTLASDTHKFEARYLDSLIGPLPESGKVYRERSPIFNAEKIIDPVAVYQGEIDEVVPRAQSDSIIESLRQRRVPHLYQVYQGEGHGWRKPETIEHFYNSVDKFLKEHVLFT